jgi:arsenate reductase-like glutaredoxin family protein
MITIFHNPNCGTSRKRLALIRNSGVEPEVLVDLLVNQHGAFTKAGGEMVINKKGSRV